MLEHTQSIFSQAPAEVAQPFHSNPPHADTLRRSAREVFQFQIFEPPRSRAKEQAAEIPLALSSPYPQKN